MHHWFRHFVPAALLLTAVTGAGAAPDRAHLEGVSIPSLQAVYLECERASATALLDSASAASCSAVHEELKERAFGGDWLRMRDWWQAEKAQAASRPAQRGAAQ